MKRVVEYLEKYACPEDVIRRWKKHQLSDCSPSPEICRECWANVEKQLESEAEK